MQYIPKPIVFLTRIRAITEAIYGKVECTLVRYLDRGNFHDIRIGQQKAGEMSSFTTTEAQRGRGRRSNEAIRVTTTIDNKQGLQYSTSFLT